MKALLKYDAWYFLKTSKFIVLGVFAIFLAAMSTLTAFYYNRIIEFAFRAEGIHDVTLPDATVDEAYVQFFSNFTQIYLIVILFVAVAYFTHDSQRGHFPMLFTKPIKRHHFVMAKSTMILLSLFASMLAAFAFFAYYTWYVFGEFDVARFAFALLLYFVFVALILHVTLLISVCFKGFVIPMIGGLVIFFILSLTSAVDIAWLRMMPTHLVAAPLRFMQAGYTTTQAVGALLINAFLTVCLLAVSSRVFMRRSLL